MEASTWAKVEWHLIKGCIPISDHTLEIKTLSSSLASIHVPVNRDNVLSVDVSQCACPMFFIFHK